MSIYIPVSVGELIDKITILEIKMQHIFDQEKYQNIRNEYALLLQVVREQQLLLNEDPMLTWKQELWKINLNIWNAEEKLKNMKEDDEKYAHISHISHSNNYQRYSVKQQINKHFSSDIQEEKSYS